MNAHQILPKLVLGRGTARRVVEGSPAQLAGFARYPSVIASRCHLPEQAQGGLQA